MRESQTVDYAKVNYTIRRLCVGNLIFSWVCFLFYLLAHVSVIFYLIYPVALAAMMVSLFFSCVFAFGAIATNSISGQNRLRLNVMPVLCILFSSPSLIVIVGFFL